MIEVCHGIEPVPQPQPARNPGGDCFACALTAALRFLGADGGFDEVWPLFEAEYSDPAAQRNLQRLREAVGAALDTDPRGDDHLEHARRRIRAERELERVYAEVAAEKPKTTTNNVWGRGGMEHAVRKAGREFDLDLDVHYDLVEPSFQIDIWSHAWFWQEPAGTWARRLEGWLRCGYVAFAEQRYAGDGPFNEELQARSTDHVVLIDGVRLGWDGRARSSWNEYAHVVCSTGRGAYWIKVRDLMRKHGTAGLMLVRRIDR